MAIEFLPDEPELIIGAERYLNAFYALTSDRQIGAMGGCGPIPWLAIDRYAQRMSIFFDEFDRLVRMIRAIDGEYLAHEAERTKAQMDEKK